MDSRSITISSLNRLGPYVKNLKEKIIILFAFHRVAVSLASPKRPSGRRWARKASLFMLNSFSMGRARGD